MKYWKRSIHKPLVSTMAQLSQGPYISSTRPLGLQSLTVGDIIDHQRKESRGNLIDSILNQSNAHAIKSIPLINISDDDRLIWKFSPNGSFSVKTS